MGFFRKIKKAFFLSFFLLLLVSIPVTLFLISQRQEVRQQAQTTSCPIPSQVTGVKITYPNCEGTQCSFTQANCSWDASTDATSYKLKITEVDTEAIVKDETVTSTTRVVFSVTQGRTYRCEVSAINSCGNKGPSGTDTVLCQVEGAVVSPTPTPSPTGEPAPSPTGEPTLTLTPTPLPTSPPSTKAPVPTLPAPGSAETLIIGGIGTLILMLVGSFLLFF